MTTSLAWPAAMAGSDHQELEVSARPVEGSRSTRRLRKQGLVPGVVYGGGDEPLTFAVDALTLRSTLAHAGAVLDLKVDAVAPPR
jgi:large subunit ribosomal protein L25